MVWTFVVVAVCAGLVWLSVKVVRVLNKVDRSK